MRVTGEIFVERIVVREAGWSTQPLPAVGSAARKGQSDRPGLPGVPRPICL